MSSSRRCLAVVVALTLIVELPGCAPSSGRSWGVRSGSGSQRNNDVTYSYGVMALTRDGQVYLLLAAARGTGNSYRGGEGKYQGELLANNGVKVAWSSTTQDGQSGRVEIDNQEFDLSEGPLFLVSINGDSIEVEQHRIAAEQLEVLSDVKKSLGVMKADAQLAKFLDHCKDSE